MSAVNLGRCQAEARRESARASLSAPRHDYGAFGKWRDGLEADRAGSRPSGVPRRPAADEAARMPDHGDEPGDPEMDFALHRLAMRIAALEAMIARSCVECERLQPDGEPGWEMYVTVDDEPALYCPECAEREFGAGSA